MDNNINIYLDTIVFRIQNFGGASTYWKELLSNFIQLKHINIIVQSDNINELNNDGQYILKSINDSNKLLVEKTLPASILRYLPFTRRLPAKSIYHSSYYRTCFQKNVINIFTVHDFTHNRGLASKFPRKLVHIGLTSLGLINANGIICISENTKRDLMHFFPKISENKIRVIYHGISEDFFPIKKTPDVYFKGLFHLDNPYVIFIGKRAGYKKFDIVVEAIKNVDNMKLIIVGGGSLSVSESMHLNKNIPNKYFKIDNLDNSDLNILYNHAYSLIYPSIYEGFGIPILEAMKAGCPVITNNLSSIPEVAGDAALIISEITSESILNKIYLLRNLDFRKSLIKKGLLQSEKFTWEKCFLETYQFYKEIYEKKFGRYC
jgi:glycosyltransferase involved in cell wall biosynthesis